MYKLIFVLLAGALCSASAGRIAQHDFQRDIGSGKLPSRSCGLYFILIPPCS